MPSRDIITRDVVTPAPVAPRHIARTFRRLRASARPQLWTDYNTDLPFKNDELAQLAPCPRRVTLSKSCPAVPSFVRILI